MAVLAAIDLLFRIPHWQERKPFYLHCRRLGGYSALVDFPLSGVLVLLPSTAHSSRVFLILGYLLTWCH